MMIAPLPLVARRALDRRRVQRDDLHPGLGGGGESDPLAVMLGLVVDR